MRCIIRKRKIGPVLQSRMAFVLFLCGLWAGVSAASITIDFSQSQGRMKVQNGVNGGPFWAAFINPAMVQRHKNAGFAITRFHDCHWPNPDVVDIHCIFPLFYRDANDSMNYFFKKTDDFVAPVIQNGSQILWRLGESIEHVTSFFIDPPSDFNKWATICVNIIRHYNAGWNKGFHYGIKYWEVWNEPDKGNMWRGSPDQYLQLYAATVKAIKAYDPTLKVGGPATSGGSGGFVNTFLAYCRDNSLPLDFFSYHGYSSSPSAYKSSIEGVRNLLNSYGFTKTEIHFTEWKYFAGDWDILMTSDSSRYMQKKAAYEAMQTGPAVSSLIASTLIAFQDSPLDMCYYYTSDNGLWGMFDRHGNPFTSYYAYVAWNQLLQAAPNRVAVTGSLSGEQRVIAGKSDNGSEAAFMVSNYGQGQTQFSVTLNNIPISGTVRTSRYVIDATRNFQLASSETVSGTNPSITLDLAPNSVWLVKLTTN